MRAPTTLIPLLLVSVLAGPACSNQAGDADSEFVTFTSEEGGFQVDLPGDPIRSARNESAGDFTLNVVHFSVDNGEEAVSVSFVDYPDRIESEDSRELLDSIAERAAMPVGEDEDSEIRTLTSKESTTAYGYDAVDFEVQIGERHLRARAVLVGARMYLMQVVRESGAGETGTFDRLTDSFELQA